MHAAQVCGVHERTVRQHRAKDPVFAAEWDEALESGTQVMEQEAFRRAVHGTTEPVVSAGKYVTDVQKYSDNLLMFMLKARRPEVYRDNVNVEVYIRKAAIEAGIDPDAAVAEAQAIVKESKAR